MPCPVFDLKKNSDNKVISLIGMSGLGKTYLSTILADAGWCHYSCDVEIASMLDIPVTAADLSPLSRYIGQLGDEGQGGLPLTQFQQRQRQYYMAECQALSDLPAAILRARGDGKKHLVNDTSGSFCEIDDEEIIKTVARHSLIVYIKANKEEEREIVERAKQYPKPLYYPSDKLQGWVDEYMAEGNKKSVEEITPKDFARWVFPKLFRTRLPKYERIANEYGVTVASDALRDVKNAQEFLDVIERSTA